MFKEFKTFAMRGNVIDLAVGVIIGAAFGKVVSSLVDDIIMPPIGRVAWSYRFFELVHKSEWDALRHAGGGESSCGADDKLWFVFEYDH